jgi:hypothetical protein
LQCRNPLYEFNLGKGTANQWVTENLTMFNSGQDTPFCVLNGPYAEPFFRKQTFLEMAADEGVEFFALEDCDWQNKRMKELQVEFTFPSHPERKEVRFRMSYFFSPQDGWICCGRRIHAIKGSAVKQSDTLYFYEQIAGQKYPALKRVEERGKQEPDKDKAQYSDVTLITKFERSPPFADGDFRLSAFGLPEPASLERDKPTRWYLWAGAAGILCLGLGLVLFRLKGAQVNRSLLGKA